MRFIKFSAKIQKIYYNQQLEFRNEKTTEFLNRLKHYLCTNNFNLPNSEYT